jgi:hypothetical protein
LQIGGNEQGYVYCPLAIQKSKAARRGVKEVKEVKKVKSQKSKPETITMMGKNFFKRKINPEDVFRSEPECRFKGKDVIFGTIRMDRNKISDFIYSAADLIDDGIPITHAFDFVVRSIKEEFLLQGEERSEEEIRAAVQRLVFKEGVDL